MWWYECRNERYSSLLNLLSRWSFLSYAYICIQSFENEIMFNQYIHKSQIVSLSANVKRDITSMLNRNCSSLDISVFIWSVCVYIVCLLFIIIYSYYFRVLPSVAGNKCTVHYSSSSSWDSPDCIDCSFPPWQECGTGELRGWWRPTYTQSSHKRNLFIYS